MMEMDEALRRSVYNRIHYAVTHGRIPDIYIAWRLIKRPVSSMKSVVDDLESIAAELADYHSERIVKESFFYSRHDREGSINEATADAKTQSTIKSIEDAFVSKCAPTAATEPHLDYIGDKIREAGDKIESAAASLSDIHDRMNELTDKG